MKSVLIVGLGSFLGGMARYLISLVMAKNDIATSPLLATFLANFMGCFLIGLFLGWGLKNHASWSPELTLLLTTGFCGGLTTFSTFSLENVKLFQSDQLLILSLYLGGSLILGLLATYAGLLITKYSL